MSLTENFTEPATPDRPLSAPASETASYRRQAGLAMNGLISISESAARLLGFAPDQMMRGAKNTFSELVHEEDRAKIRGQERSAIASKQSFSVDYRMRRADGSYLWIWDRGCPIYDDRGDLVWIEGQLQDVTERKKVEHEDLAESEARYRQLLDLAPIAIIVSTNGIVRFVNRAGIKIMGVEDEREMVGTFTGDFVHPDSRPALAERIRAIVENGEETEAAFLKMIRPDGKVITVESAAGPIMYRGELSIQTVMRDVTERLELEEQLRQSQKMEAIGRLAGGIAHDFNNLLTAINGYASFGLQKIGIDHRVRRDLQQILKAGESGASLVSQLLAFSRKQVLQPKVLDLNALIGNFEKMLQRMIGEDVELKTELASPLASVCADPGQMEQVLMNLVVNARDAMPHGGSIAIKTTMCQESRSSKADSSENASQILITISDTGEGMNKETLRQAFDPFFTTKASGQGTGLGLSTVHGIVEQSGGSIRVESRPGEGTTFKILLPAVEQVLEAEIVPAPALDRGSETILLVEDDPLVRELTRDVLMSNGYEVVSACDGDEALQIIKRENLNLHLMLTDVVMPGMSGTELALRLSSTLPDVRVLYMSGYTEDSIVLRSLGEDSINFLPKPFNPGELIFKVRDVLDAA